MGGMTVARLHEAMKLQLTGALTDQFSAKLSRTLFVEIDNLMKESENLENLQALAISVFTKLFIQSYYSEDTGMMSKAAFRDDIMKAIEKQLTSQASQASSMVPMLE
jgi:hypothetical protein